MTEATVANSQSVHVSDSSVMTRIFYAFAVLAALSFGISLAGKWLGRSIALAGHSEDTALHEVVIGDDVIVVPSNIIRFADQRRNGVAGRLDLYMRWPELDGYNASAREDFNHANGSRNIIFLSYGERMMSRDMSGRLDPIYSSLMDGQGSSGPGGSEFYNFKEDTGYLNEVLVVGRKPGKTPFVARCLTGESAAQSLAGCERDIHVGKHLSLTYRFPEALLDEWEELDAKISAKASSLLKTGD